MTVQTPVVTRVQGGVAHVLLNRPEVRNAVTIDLARALHDALSDAAVYADLIVIRGPGATSARAATSARWPGCASRVRRRCARCSRRSSRPAS